MKKLCKQILGFMFILLLITSCNNTQVKSTEKQLAELKSSKWTNLSTQYDSPHADKEIKKEISTKVLAKWWTILGDDTLTDLITLALNNNKNLQEARAKVNEARAALGISKSKLLPWLDSNNSWNRVKTSDNSLRESGIANTYKLEIDASWEIDIFGVNRHQVKSAVANLQLQHAQLHSTWVTLSSEVAINYISLRTLQERLRVAEDNLALQENMTQLLQSKYNAGLIDELYLNQSKYTASQIKSTIPTIKISIEETLNNLAILTGHVPGSLNEILSKKKKLPNINEMIYVGIPAETLRQRPDIQVAEYQLESQIAKTKSARAELRPKLTLSGSIGLESFSSGSLLSGASKGFSLLPQITFPIFNAGSIRRNIEVQSAKEEQYLAVYENTILNAVAEVKNSLTAISQETKKNTSLKEGVDSASLALKIAKSRYNNGLENFQSVLDAQMALLSLEDQYVISEGQKLSNLIGLFKALGGGWEPLVKDQTKITNKK